MEAESPTLKRKLWYMIASWILIDSKQKLIEEVFKKHQTRRFPAFFQKNWWNEFFCQNNLINCQFLGISPLDWMQNNKEKLMILFYKKSVTNSPTYWQTARWADQQWNNRTSCGSGSAINNNDWDKECEGCKLRLWFYLWSFLLSALTSF